jgi:hypothetical protein
MTTPAMFAALTEENVQRYARLHEVTADLEALKAEHATLLAERTNPPPVRADGLIGEPPPRHEIQETVLNNLRKIFAARDQFQLENGRAPRSVEELVGAGAYIKRLVPFDGEDYAALPLNEGVLIVTTLSGITVQYGDGTGENATTQIDYPPEIARVKSILTAIRPAARAAFEAYRLAHQGKDPESTEAVAPYFTNPQDRALYLEYLEARRAARGQ